MDYKIPYNKPFLVGNELTYIRQATESGKLSGNGHYTKECQAFFEQRFGFGKCLLTSSCSDALEMCALLLDLKEGDEVIIPSYTFVSTANAFILRGAKIVFADSSKDHPNIDAALLEDLINPKTKAIVVVHYAGHACDMSKIMALAEKYNLTIIEDAAHSTDARFQDRPLGSIGHLATFSFHETKNIISGEGGMLVVNDLRFKDRAEIIWEKGTNRSAFFRGEVDKYNWVDIGSSFLPSEVTAAFLYAQLEHFDVIHEKRRTIWDKYFSELQELSDKVQLPQVPSYGDNNGHLFYLICRDGKQRNDLLTHLKAKGILAVFHYLALHNSPYFKEKHDGRHLPQSERYTDCLIRLPLFYELKENDQDFIIAEVKRYFEKI